MPDTVINRVNKLGEDEPEHLVFIDRSGRLIGNIELPGVDGDENETPQQLGDASAVEHNDLEIALNEEAEEEAIQEQ
jgi:hypothetical protein